MQTATTNGPYPFRQVDSYLRIRASEEAKSSGLLSSLKNDATGITAKAPCYFECRFIGSSTLVGTWPAFWLMTDYMTDFVQGRCLRMPGDENQLGAGQARATVGGDT